MSGIACREESVAPGVPRPLQRQHAFRPQQRRGHGKGEWEEHPGGGGAGEIAGFLTVELHCDTSDADTLLVQGLMYAERYFLHVSFRLQALAAFRQLFSFVEAVCASPKTHLGCDVFFYQM
ncbi:hypothetical protein EYF80_009725 [Liparis tanakae]|uniref:Uncharacterized protein n=1 Tax=Liparis tanakae TaxID=230148 RepID=A0A4Z2IS98_9TELE|nr:hypothetical protein EYF80_009725 [Liparis tanakae]